MSLVEPSSPPRIVLIDDEQKVRETLVRQLSQIEIETEQVHPDVVATESIDAFVFELSRARTDLAIIDLKLDPDSKSLVKGRDLIRRTSQGFDCMIVVYTSEPDQIDEPEYLDIGADDYIPKTANFWLLESRIKALLRRQLRHRRAVAREVFSNGTIFSLGGWLFDLSQRRLTNKEGASVLLTISEYELLQHLVSTEGNYVTFEAYADAIIDRGGERADRRLDNTVHRLRKKLGPNFPLTTIRGGGYELRGITTY